jgi:hypothetical protein
MTIKTKFKQDSKARGSINPKDESFNFDLWSKEVRIQMLKTLEKKLGSEILIV